MYRSDTAVPTIFFQKHVGAAVSTLLGVDTAENEHLKVYQKRIWILEAKSWKHVRIKFHLHRYYHFIRLMGREASHLTLEVAMQCQPNLTLISEEIRAKGTSLEEIVSSVTDLVVEREKKGLKHGVILLPEGLIDFIPEFKPLIAEINEVLAKGVEAEQVADQLSDTCRIEKGQELEIRHPKGRTDESRPTFEETNS